METPQTKQDAASKAKQDAAWKKFEQGAAYAATDDDAAALVGPTLQVISTYAATWPPPYGPIIAVVVSKAAEGWNAVRGEMMLATKLSARYLPLNIADKVVKQLHNAPLHWWQETAKDKMAQASMDGFMGDPTGSMRQMLKVAGLDVDCTWRLADLVYAYAVQQGAQAWQAATVAAGIGNSTARGANGSKNFHMRVDQVSGVPGSWKTQTAQASWQIRVQAQGGVLLTAAQASDLLHRSDVSSGSGLALGLGLLAVAAKVML